MAEDFAPVPIAQIVAEHYEAMYRYAYRLAGAPADAEDLAQQTFLIAQQKLELLRSDTSVRPWLYTILRNVFLRGRQRWRPLSACDVQLEADSLPSHAAADDEIDLERLQKSLNELPEGMRVVLMMFYYEGCSYREIGEKLEMPIGTVMSRLSRAKGLLREKLFEPADESTDEPVQREVSYE